MCNANSNSFYSNTNNFNWNGFYQSWQKFVSIMIEIISIQIDIISIQTEIVSIQTQIIPIKTAFSRRDKNPWSIHMNYTGASNHVQTQNRYSWCEMCTVHVRSHFDSITKLLFGFKCKDSFMQLNLVARTDARQTHIESFEVFFSVFSHCGPIFVFCSHVPHNEVSFEVVKLNMFNGI